MDVLMKTIEHATNNEIEKILTRLAKENELDADTLIHKYLYQIPDEKTDEKIVIKDEVNVIKEEAKAVKEEAKAVKEEAKAKAKEETKAAKEKAKEEAKAAKEKAKEEAKAAKEKAKEEAKTAKEKAKEEAKAAKEKAKGKTNKAKQVKKEKHTQPPSPSKEILDAEEELFDNNKVNERDDGISFKDISLKFNVFDYDDNEIPDNYKTAKENMFSETENESLFI